MPRFEGVGRPKPLISLVSPTPPGPTIPFRPETAPFHGGVKLAEFRGFPGIYERISGNGDAPSGALAPILRIRLCGPICATKPSVQSLVACLCRCSTTIPFRPETAPFHGGVKLAEFRGFPGVYERISGNGDAPSGALAPILRIRLCGPICTTKPSAQSLLFLCAREPGQQRCPRSRDPFAAGRRSDLPGKKCGLQWASCSTHCNNQNGLYFRVGGQGHKFN